MSLYAPSFHGLHHQHENHGRILLAASSSLHLLIVHSSVGVTQQPGFNAGAGLVNHGHRKGGSKWPLDLLSCTATAGRSR
jgi:hypothetical protein